MAILARLRVFAPLLAIALWIGVAESARAAFPLWTQNAEGQFIVINTANGKYHLAPHQVPGLDQANVLSSFAYDSANDLLWLLIDSTTLSPDAPPQHQTLMESFDPRTGFTQVRGSFGDMMLYSLTYRKSDGYLYALIAYPGLPLDLYYVARLTPGAPGIDVFNPPTIERISQIQPKTVEWTPGVGETPNGAYTVENTPPITLCFDPMTDQAYLTSSPNGEGWMFTLDVTTGETTTIAATGLPIAQTFEPMTEISFLAVVGPTQPGYIGYDNLRSGKSGQLPALPLNRQTSLAFVPMAAGH